MSHFTTDKGDIGVARVTADLLEKDFEVLTPVSASAPYDLVVIKNNVFYKIQVKYRRLNKGALTVQLRRAGRIEHKIKYRSFDKEEINVFAIYCPDTNSCYYIPMCLGQNRCITLRFNKHINGTYKTIRWASDYIKFPYE